jgi:hypothetical protein
MTLESLCDVLATAGLAFVIVVCVYWMGIEIMNRIEKDNEE